jgi:hypothetical protein
LSGRSEGFIRQNQLLRNLQVGHFLKFIVAGRSCEVAF